MQSRDSHPRSVLLVLHEETLGGATRAVLRAIEPLVADGLELHIWCSRPSTLYDELAARGFDVAGAPRLLRYSWSTLRHPPGVLRRTVSVPGSLRAFRRHLRSLRPDLVHANATLSLPEAAAARAAGFPVLFHSHEAEWPGAKGALLRRSVWRVAHEVAAVSRANAAPLAHRGREPLLLPEPGPEPRPPVSRLKAPDAPVVVASVGAISRRKGTDVFVDAAERLQRLDEPLQLELAGAVEDAPSASWAREQLDRARRAGISYREHVDVERELQGWDIVVMPSRQDPFPLVVLEAMAAARPVIGSRRDGIEEQLGGGAGVLVPAEDGDALAAAIAQLAADPARRAELGAAGHKRVMGMYTPEHAARRLRDAYARTLARAAG